MKHYEVQKLIRASKLHYTQRIVLLEVSFVASGDEGLCWEMQESIAAATGLSVRTVSRDLPRLVAAKILLVVRDKTRRTTVYRVNPAAIPLRPADDPAPGAEQSDTDADEPADDSAPHAEHSAPGVNGLRTTCGTTPHHMRGHSAPGADDPFLDPSQDPSLDPEESARARDPSAASSLDLEAVAAITATIRGREVRPLEASRDAPLVEALLSLDPGRPIGRLLEEVRLVCDWAVGSAQGRDEIGGIRQSTGQPWAPDRTHRPSYVLDPARFPDWLDEARRWDRQGRPPPRQVPPAAARRGGSTAGDGAIQRAIQRRLGGNQVGVEVIDGER